MGDKQSERPLFNKCLAVIDSCVTPEQLKVARLYIIHADNGLVGRDDNRLLWTRLAARDIEIHLAAQEQERGC